jgi:hypothetical protein
MDRPHRVHPITSCVKSFLENSEWLFIEIAQKDDMSIARQFLGVQEVEDEVTKGTSGITASVFACLAKFRSPVAGHKANRVSICKNVNYWHCSCLPGQIRWQQRLLNSSDRFRKERSYFQARSFFWLQIERENCVVRKAILLNPFCRRRGYFAEEYYKLIVFRDWA